MKYTVLNKWVIFSIHLLVWVGLLFASFSFVSRLGLSRESVILWSLSDVVTQAILTYVNVFVYLPKFFKERRYVVYAIAIIITIAILGFLRMQFFVSLIEELDEPPFIYPAVFPLVGFFFISSTGWFVTDWFRSRKREVELANSQLDSELKFLKLQLNPHFLFNTLNNIYSLAYFNDRNTPQAIMKLSNMMRHMIYDSQDKFISLTKEVEFIDNFIELQKIKIDNPPQINFTKKGIREIHKIAPLLFLAFLENSFKHGKQGEIDIDLRVEENILHFRILNQLPQKPTTQQEKSGVGLINVKKRLELIYPNKHELIMNSVDNVFTVELNVDIS